MGLRASVCSDMLRLRASSHPCRIFCDMLTQPLTMAQLQDPCMNGFDLRECFELLMLFAHRLRSGPCAYRRALKCVSEGPVRSGLCVRTAKQRSMFPIAGAEPRARSAGDAVGTPRGLVRSGNSEERATHALHACGPCGCTFLRCSNRCRGNPVQLSASALGAVLRRCCLVQRQDRPPCLNVQGR